MSADQPDIRGEVYDLGVVNLASNTGAEEEFTMPYDGYLYRVGATWPAGASNAIGFNLELDEPNVRPADAQVELGISPDQLEAVRRVADNEGVILPQNHPNPEYIADDDRNIQFFPIRKVPQGIDIRANIRNDSNNNPLDLQVRVSVLNFDPRAIQSLQTGGAV